MKQLLRYVVIAFFLSAFPNFISAQTGNCSALVFSDLRGLPGDTVCVDISVQNISSLLSMQMSFAYPEGPLDFVSVTNFQLPGMSASNFGVQGMPGIPPGRITVSWFDPFLNGAFLDDGDVLFSFCFKITGSAGSNDVFAIVETPTPIEVVNANGNTFNFDVVPGSVMTQDDDSNLRAVTICADSSACIQPVNGSIELCVSGGIPPYSYQWSGPGGFTSNSEDLNGLTPGSYEVIVTDATGHSVSGRPLLQSGLLTGIVGDTTICAGGTAALWLDAINSITSWSPSAGLSCVDCPNPVAAPAATTTYTGTATNGQGCTQSALVTVFVRNYEDFSNSDFSNSPVCIGGNLQLAVPAGFNFQSYQWSGPDGFTATGPAATISGVNADQAGSYTLTATDDLGCEAAAAFEVIVGAPPVLTAAETIDASCPGSNDGAIAIDVAGNGPFAFQWSHGFTGEDPDGLLPGPYGVVITDAFQCTTQFNFEVGPAPLTAVVNSIPAQCNDQFSAFVISEVNGGAGAPYTYSTDGGITRLPVTGDTVSIEINSWQGLLIFDANDCSISPNVVIVIPPDIAVTLVSEVRPTCPETANGSLEWQITGAFLPFEIDWSTGASTTNAAALDQLPSGTYRGTLTDANGCEVVISAELPPLFEQCRSEYVFDLLIGESIPYCDNYPESVGFQITEITCQPDPNVFEYEIFSNIPCINFTATGGGLDSLCLRICNQNDPADCIDAVIYINVLPRDVWPGDANNDGRANHYDVLQLGMAYGKTGPERPLASLDWQAQDAFDWESSTPQSSVNYKHIDTNGDGLIDRADTLALAQNWGLSHGFDGGSPSPLELSEQTPDGAPLYIDASVLEAGGEYSLPIQLGNNAQPVSFVYGIAFRLTCDPDIIDPSTLSVDWQDSWLAAGSDGNVIAMWRPGATPGQLQLAQTRFDGVDYSGFGPLGYLRFKVRDDIFATPGSLVTTFVIDSVRLIASTENVWPVNTTPQDVTVISGSSEPEWAEQIEIFPNPVGNLLYIRTGGIILDHVVIYDVWGRQVQPHNAAATDPIDVSSLPAGTYTLRLTANGEYLNRLIVVIE